MAAAVGLGRAARGGEIARECPIRNSLGTLHQTLRHDDFSPAHCAVACEHDAPECTDVKHADDATWALLQADLRALLPSETSTALSHSDGYLSGWRHCASLHAGSCIA